MTDVQADARIDILLATYNGAAFLEEQIASILQQSYRNWRLLVRDDGSTDRTVDILEQSAKDHPDRIVLFADGDGNLGCTGNFNRLMEHSTADYVALCDQDDVWLAHKLAVSMERMRALERSHGSEPPLLVHSDLCTVDEALRTVDRSFWRYQGLRPAYANDFDRLLVHNVVTGCSMLINRPLKDRALPIPDEAKVHDWWIALVAAAFGVVGEISTPTVLYRQHGNNRTGAQAFGGWRFLIRAMEFAKDLSDLRVRLFNTWRQARTFVTRYQGDLGHRHRAVLNDILTMPETGLLKRFFRAIRHGTRPPEGLYWMAFALLVPSKTDRAMAGASARLPTDGNHGDDRVTR